MISEDAVDSQEITEPENPEDDSDMLEEEPETPEIKPTFGGWLHKLRTGKEMSLRELGAKSGLHASTLSRLENGLLAPPAKSVVDAIVNALMLNEIGAEMLHEAALGRPRPFPDVSQTTPVDPEQPPPDEVPVRFEESDPRATQQGVYQEQEQNWVEIGSDDSWEPEPEIDPALAAEAKEKRRVEIKAVLSTLARLSKVKIPYPQKLIDEPPDGITLELSHVAGDAITNHAILEWDTPEGVSAVQAALGVATNAIKLQCSGDQWVTLAQKRKDEEPAPVARGPAPQQPMYPQQAQAYPGWGQQPGPQWQPPQYPAAPSGPPGPYWPDQGGYQPPRAGAQQPVAYPPPTARGMPVQDGFTSVKVRQAPPPEVAAALQQLDPTMPPPLHAISHWGPRRRMPRGAGIQLGTEHVKFQSRRGRH